MHWAWSCQSWLTHKDAIDSTGNSSLDEVISMGKPLDCPRINKKGSSDASGAPDAAGLGRLSHRASECKWMQVKQVQPHQPWSLYIHVGGC